LLPSLFTLLFNFVNVYTIHYRTCTHPWLPRLTSRLVGPTFVRSFWLMTGYRIGSCWVVYPGLYCNSSVPEQMREGNQEGSG